MKPYHSKDTPTFVIRQNGDAWDRPFAVVYEAGFGEEGKGTVESVEALDQKGRFCGFKISSTVGGRKLTEYALILESDQQYTDPGLDLSFEGHFAILTPEGNGGSGSLYLGDSGSIRFGERSLSGKPKLVEW
ncbi:hypothetical protein [Pelagicoccus enzymogenes]|uniref:hypothetical protein n=1 Tax=Pelagicoccus enzymogenes TaxID=2773457 RepID=UPI0028118531|nr:hypothetical protein [Pelagicoccus enzymogenes]